MTRGHSTDGSCTWPFQPHSGDLNVDGGFNPRNRRIADRVALATVENIPGLTIRMCPMSCISSLASTVA
jgi:hypothetical protein